MNLAFQIAIGIILVWVAVYLIKLLHPYFRIQKMEKVANSFYSSAKQVREQIAEKPDSRFPYSFSDKRTSLEIADELCDKLDKMYVLYNQLVIKHRHNTYRIKLQYATDWLNYTFAVSSKIGDILWGGVGFPDDEKEIKKLKEEKMKEAITIDEVEKEFKKLAAVK